MILDVSTWCQHVEASHYQKYSRIPKYHCQQDAPASLAGFSGLLDRVSRVSVHFSFYIIFYRIFHLFVPTL
jgi:hypothetical protein